MDVFELLSAKLRNDVCPIYTSSDSNRDIAALATAMSLPPHVYQSTKELPQHFAFFKKTLRMTKSKWNSLLQKFKVHKIKNPRLPPTGVRRILLAEHGGDPAKWLADMIYCDTWFARALLPLPDDKPIPHGLRLYNIFKVIEQYPRHAALKLVQRWKALMLSNQSGVTTQVINDDSDLIATPRVLFNLIADRINHEELSEKLRNAELGSVGRGAFYRAKQIDKYVSQDVDLDECCQYIAGNNKCFLEQLMNSYHGRLERQVEDLGHTCEQVRQYTTEFLEQLVHKSIFKNNLKLKWLNDHNLDILEFEDDWEDKTEPIISKVRDNATGLDTDVLMPMYELLHKSRYAPEHAQQLINEFRRYAELRDALHEQGLSIREDSRICAEYVLYGKYEGPDMPRVFASDLMRVVELMREMGFLFQRTEYASYRRNRPVVRAKELALREYLYQDSIQCADRYAALPMRLRAFASFIKATPLTSEELAEKSPGYWHFSDEQSSSDEECISDHTDHTDHTDYSDED